MLRILALLIFLSPSPALSLSFPLSFLLSSRIFMFFFSKCVCLSTLDCLPFECNENFYEFLAGDVSTAFTGEPKNDAELRINCVAIFRFIFRSLKEIERSKYSPFSKNMVEARTLHKSLIEKYEKRICTATCNAVHVCMDFTRFFLFCSFVGLFVYYNESRVDCARQTFVTMHYAIHFF